MVHENNFLLNLKEPALEEGFMDRLGIEGAAEKLSDKGKSPRLASFINHLLGEDDRRSLSRYT